MVTLYCCQNQNWLRFFVSSNHWSNPRATIGTEIPVYAWAKVLAEIQTKYGFKNGQIDTRAIEYNMAAAPGTSVVYYVTWKEVRETGTGNVSITSSTLNVSFRVKTNVVYEVSSEPRNCP